MTCVWEGGKQLQGEDGYATKERKQGCGRRREGERGKRGRLSKLIKCLEGRKLPASIPVPLDKLAHCSLQFLCSAEVAS